jgi:membrane protease YdiL (CAAX protease family)
VIRARTRSIWPAFGLHVAIDAVAALGSSP